MKPLCRIFYTLSDVNKPECTDLNPNWMYCLIFNFESYFLSIAVCCFVYCDISTSLARFDAVISCH